MHRNITPSSLKRAQWINDLTAALADAEKLLALLEGGAESHGEAARLQSRIQSVRSELDLLNRVMAGEARVVGSAWPSLGATSTDKAGAPAA